MIDGNNSLPQLPEGWVWVRLGEVASLNPKSADYIPDELEVSFIPMKYLEELTGQVDLSLTRRYSEVKKGYTAFKNGDVIFAKITPCMENGKVGIVNKLKNGIGFGSTEFHVVRLFNGRMPNKFVFFFLVRESFRRDARMHMTGSAGQLRVPKDYLEEVSFPLPPLLEQHRIVDKIEELFTRLDAGLEALRKVKTQLGRYRQAVLKYAFEGKLTKEWREARKGEMEPAFVLLERIKEERGKKGKGQLKELSSLDTSNLPELPEGWVWTRIGELAETIQYGFTAKSTKVPVGPKMLRITDIQNNSVNWSSVPYCQIDQSEKQNYLLEEGHLVFARTGATVGKSFLITGQFPEAIFASYLIRIIFSKFIAEKFVYSFFQSNTYWSQIYRGQLGIGQPNVNSQTLSKLILPLAPFPEQQKVVEEIERCFSVADEIEKVVEQSLKQAERLRQSILKRAFEGKLVPQNPTDEPAEELLKRIKMEKAKRQATALKA